MKVRHRNKSIISVEWEVADEAKAYYIVKDPAGFLRVLAKADYEPVQEWVIVPIENISIDTRGYNGLSGNCNSYFFVDKYGKNITSDHEPIIIDGKVGLRRRKQ